MGGGKLQVVALFRVGDAAAREKGPADEGRAAAFLLQDAEIYMVGEGAADLRAEGVKDFCELFRVRDGKALLARGPLGGQTVKRQGKSLFEKPGQAGGEIRACGNDAYFLV